MSTPNWPTYLESQADVVTYLEKARPLALFQVIFDVDFHEPLDQRSDCTAYTQDNETPFETTLVGRVSQKVEPPITDLQTFSYGHRTLRLSTGDPDSDLARIVTEQLRPLSDAIEHDEYPLNWAIHFPTDTSPPAIAATTHIELHVYRVHGENRSRYGSTPAQRTHFLSKKRSEQRQSLQNSRPSPSGPEPGRAGQPTLRLVTLEATDDAVESVAPGVVVEEPATQKRKAESRMAAGSSKKVRRSPRLVV
ncbi:hypothetical protein C8J57DRAFT_1224781 [Mycena rebaudengoi]|nr:hypothetical protein C8J57DRAFT_1224781 [Mycena rebaudengoi]